MAAEILHNAFSFWSEGGSGRLLGSHHLEGNIRQSIRVILYTEKGERPFQPEFGSRLSQFVFRSAEASLLQKLSQEVQDCLERFEPRIEVDHIHCEGSDPDGHQIMIHLKYRILETGSHQSLSLPLQV
jgi:phage baseplate assembly protein W